MVGNGRSTEFFRTRHAKYAILRHADPVPNVQNHVTFRTHFTGSILSPLLLYTLDNTGVIGQSLPPKNDFEHARGLRNSAYAVNLTYETYQHIYQRVR